MSRKPSTSVNRAVPGGLGSGQRERRRQTALREGNHRRHGASSISIRINRLNFGDDDVLIGSLVAEVLGGDGSGDEESVG